MLPGTGKGIEDLCIPVNDIGRDKAACSGYETCPRSRH
jgi:hypothetical protein